MKKESLELIEQIRFKDEKEKEIFIICEELKDIPYSTLAKMANALIVWEWPDELPGRPKGWDGMSDDEKYDWTAPIIKMIKVIIGEKAIARYRMTNEDGMTDREFEDWWDSNANKELQELLDEIYKNDYEGCTGDTKRNNSNDFILTICSFVFGVITAFLIFILIS
ncbi:MAG: hypothetical protein E7591_00780 [Ruminococcaceae bacterium]|nr:hypothetical protein [Oscillospiraceae bacterium]